MAFFYCSDKYFSWLWVCFLTDFHCFPGNVKVFNLSEKFSNLTWKGRQKRAWYRGVASSCCALGSSGAAAEDTAAINLVLSQCRGGALLSIPCYITGLIKPWNCLGIYISMLSDWCLSNICIALLFHNQGFIANALYICNCPVKALPEQCN